MLHKCRTVNLHFVDADGGGNGADEADQLLVGVHSHPTMPLWQPARGPQGPVGWDRLTLRYTSWLDNNNIAAKPLIRYVN